MSRSTKRKLLELIFLLILSAFFYFFDQIEDYFFPSSNVQSRVVDTLSMDDTLHVYFLDVGQADSILIHYQNYNVLIDAGNRSDGSKIVSYLKSLGIQSFQYVIGTHAHEDHIGGMDQVIRAFPIEHFYMPDVAFNSKSYENVLDALLEKNVTFETPSIDSTFSLGDLIFTVLWVGDDSTDLNNTSIVLRLDYHSTSFLFTGDATTTVEKSILDKNLDVDVLKVGHHGSQYSTSAHFLKAVSPSISVISCGLQNDYGHPKDVILKKLERVDSKIYRTDFNHTILIKSDGRNLSVEFLDTDTNGGDL